MSTALASAIPGNCIIDAPGSCTVKLFRVTSFCTGEPSIIVIIPLSINRWGASPSVRMSLISPGKSVGSFHSKEFASDSVVMSLGVAEDNTWNSDMVGVSLADAINNRTLEVVTGEKLVSDSIEVPVCKSTKAELLQYCSL